MDTKSKIKSEEPYISPKIKAYSVDEILAAGGTTAFANKMGKSSERMIKQLEEMPADFNGGKNFWQRR